MNFPQQDVIGLVVLLAGFLLFLVATEWITRKFTWSPEICRKTVHIGAGVACLFFPWWLNSPLTVLILALVMSSFLIAGQKLGLLSCLTRVNRRSRGSEYYPLAIFIAFALTKETPWFYVAAIFVLCWADAAAALMGTRHGRHRFLINEESKSLEGSLTFLGIAFCGIAASLVCLSPLDNSTALLSALLVALVVTGIEAISVDGRDNLFVPLGVVLILQKITTKPISEIAYQNFSLAALMVLAVYSAKRSKALNAGASVAAILFLFATWSLGSEVWALPAVGGLLLFVWSACGSARAGVPPAVLKSGQVVAALSVPSLLVISGNLLNRYDLFLGAYTAACVTVSLSFSSWRCPSRQLLATFLFVFLPIYIIAGPRDLYVVGVILTMSLAVTLHFYSFRTDPRTPKPFALVAATAALYLAAQLTGLPLWEGYGSSLVLD